MRSEGNPPMKSKLIFTMVLVLLATWLLPGCKLFTQEVSLPGTHWTLVSLNGHELLPDSAISAAFKAGELIPLYIFGRAGCNDYSSPVELDEERSDALHPTDVRVATDRSCLSPGLLEQEGEYLAALRSGRTYEISRSRLAMKNQAGQVVLEFRIDTPSQVDALAGTRWNLETLNGHALIPGRSITIAFEEGGPYRISGSAGCNTYRWFTIELANGQIIWLILPNIGGTVTEDYCVGPVEGVMEQEREYLETLRNVTTYKVSDGRLELKNQAGEVVLVFREEPKSVNAPVLNNVWLLETLNGQAVIPGSQITATFEEEFLKSRLKVSGNAGCNAYAYMIELEQEPLAISTRIPDARGYRYAIECAGLMEQEEAYIAALLSVASYEVSVERLELKNQAGEVVLVFRSGE
jgi:heat shock protein HslJ